MHHTINPYRNHRQIKTSSKIQLLQRATHRIIILNTCRHSAVAATVDHAHMKIVARGCSRGIDMLCRNMQMSRGHSGYVLEP